MGRRKLDTCSRCGGPRDTNYSMYCRACLALRARENRVPKPRVAKPIPTQKACGDCGTVKLLEEFNRHKARADGRTTYCSACMALRARAYRAKRTPEENARLQREWYAKNKHRAKVYRRKSKLKSGYGLSIEQYEAMHEAQDGRCAICRNEPTKGRWPILYVDHDHETGRTRGLLCMPCNFAIGQLDDDIERMEAMIRYIRKYKLNVVEEEG